MHQKILSVRGSRLIEAGTIGAGHEGELTCVERSRASEHNKLAAVAGAIARLTDIQKSGDEIYTALTTQLEIPSSIDASLKCLAQVCANLELRDKSNDLCVRNPV